MVSAVYAFTLTVRKVYNDRYASASMNLLALLADDIWPVPYTSAPSLSLFSLSSLCTPWPVIGWMTMSSDAHLWSLHFCWTPTLTPGFKKLGLRLQPLKITRLRLQVKVGHRLLNLSDCDSVLSEQCWWQTNSQDFV